MTNPIFCYTTHARIIRSVLSDLGATDGLLRNRVTAIEHGHELAGQTGGLFVIVDSLPVPSDVMDMVRERGCLVWSYDDHFRRARAIRDHGCSSNLGELFGGARFLGKNAIHIPLEPIETFIGRLDDRRIDQELAGEVELGIDLSREAFKHLITTNQIDYTREAYRRDRWPKFRDTSVFVGNTVYARPKKS